MSKKQKSRKTKDKVKWIITLVVGILLTLGVIGSIIGINGLKTTEKVNRYDYEVGIINSATGRIETSDYNIYQKDLELLDGLKIDIKENATVSYKLAYYNEDKEFISMDETSSKFDFEYSADLETIPEGAVYFRIEITPDFTDGTSKINGLNIRSFTNQLTVVHKK